MLHQLLVIDAAGETQTAAAVNAADATSDYLANVPMAGTGLCFWTGQLGLMAVSPSHDCQQTKSTRELLHMVKAYKTWDITGSAHSNQVASHIQGHCLMPNAFAFMHCLQ